MRLRSFLPLTLLCLLAACAAPPPPVAEAPPSPTARPAATATRTPPRATATAAPPTPTPAPRPLTIWVAEEGAALEATRTLLVEASEDAGITLAVAPRPPDGLRLSLATAAALGEPPPDLIWGGDEALAGLLADGLLQPVEAPAATLLPALETASTAEGRRWGVPLLAHESLLLLYNRALIPAPPASGAELLSAARAATTPETAGLVMAWDEARWLLPWLYAYGGAPLAPDGTTLTLETPELASALGFLRELYVASEDETVSYGAGQRLFARGNAAFSIDGDWALPRLAAVSDTLELGIAPLPAVAVTGRPAVAPLGGTYLMLHRDLAGERLAQAQALLARLAEPAWQTRLALALGRLPADTAVLAAPELAAQPALVAAAARASLAPGLPPTQVARCALYGIDVWLPSVLSARREPAEATTLMQREAEACVARSLDNR